MAHVSPGALAEHWRAGEPFPATGEPPCTLGIGGVLALGNYEGALLAPRGEHVAFRCRDCASRFFCANTYRGIRHALRVAAAHQGACCAERRAKHQGTETAWPDAEEAA
jgi:hypothetical protein